jgi:hypothetical protein
MNNDQESRKKKQFLFNGLSETKNSIIPLGNEYIDVDPKISFGGISMMSVNTNVNEI